MVKNKKGGSGHKRMARKHVSGGGGYQNKIRKKQEEGEIYARVIKLNGGQFAHIKCHDGKTRNLVIRGQFRRRKRGNRLAADTLVLAGLRDWEVVNGKKLEKADLLEVYGTHEADRSKHITSTPNVFSVVYNLSKLYTNLLINVDLPISLSPITTILYSGVCILYSSINFGNIF